MSDKLDKTTHLATTDLEVTFIEFEILLWRVYAAFARWQTNATNFVSQYDLVAYDIAILHIIRMKARPKTALDIAKLLNRDDLPNILYSIRKLLKYGLIKKAKNSTNSRKSVKKQLMFEISETGIKETDEFLKIKKEILIEKVNELAKDGFDFKPTIRALTIMTGIYDEADRLATTYQK